MRPDDLTLLRACARPALTPDGRTAVVPVLRPDLDHDAVVGGLWSAPTDGSAPARPLTRGHRDCAPAASPDGRWIAFLRAAPGEPAQLHVVAAGGGEPVQLTRSPLGAEQPAWSPDSRRLAFLARVPEAGRYGTGVDPRGGPLAADAEPPRLITTLSYREDGLGYTRDRRPHVFVVDLPDPDAVPPPPGVAPEPVQVTRGDHTDSAVAWSPDGTRLAFVSDRHAEPVGPYGEDLRRGVWTCAPDGGDLRELVGASLTCSDLAWTADGRGVVLLAAELGPQGVDVVARPTGLFAVRVAADGGRLPGAAGEPRRLTSRDVDLGPAGAHLGVSTRGVLVQRLTRGAVHLLEVALPAADGEADGDHVDGGGRGGATARCLLDGPREVRSHATTPDGTTVVAVVASPTSAGDLHVVRGEASGAVLTDVGADLRESGAVRTPVEREVLAHDGYPVHGWVVPPDPGRHGPGPHPVLLCIHGGPFAHYGWGLFDEAQVYAGAGYAVVMANPRGSAGYGEEHGRAIRGAMGDRDAADLLAFLDGVLADPDLRLDADRVGVMGGSYGGYMTALLTTRTTRFAAAVVERGYLDADSFVGSADIGWFFPDGYHGTDPAQRRQQSPMHRVSEVRTPTLVVHSEQDWRTPVEQGQRWFAALRRQGVAAELLLFPGEGHELSRSGRPRHRQARFEHLLRWWGTRLPVTPSPAPPSPAPPSARPDGRSRDV